MLTLLYSTVWLDVWDVVLPGCTDGEGQAALKRLAKLDLELQVTYVCTFVCMYACMHACVYVCVGLQSLH